MLVRLELLGAICEYGYTPKSPPLIPPPRLSYPRLTLIGQMTPSCVIVTLSCEAHIGAWWFPTILLLLKLKYLNILRHIDT